MLRRSVWLPEHNLQRIILVWGKIIMKKLTTFSFLVLVMMLICGISVSAENNANSRIYYINSSDMNRLYSMRQDGSDIKKLSDRIASNAWESRSYIYFTVRGADSFPAPNGKEERGIFRIKKDGSDEINVINDFEDYTDDLFVSDKYVAFWSEFLDEPRLIIYDKAHFENYSSHGHYYYNYVEINKDQFKNFDICGISGDNILLCDKSKKNYYRSAIKYTPDNSLEKPVQIKKLPEITQNKLEVLSTDHYCEKGLKWKEINGAESYTVSRLNEKTGKYKKLAQTSDTSIRLDVLTNDLDAEYKVTASLNGRNKAAKLVDFENNEKYLGESGTQVVYKGKLYACMEFDPWSEQRDCLYVYDFINKDPAILYEGHVKMIFIQDDTIFYLCGSGLFSMDIDGKNIKKLFNKDDIEGTIVRNIFFTDKSIYIIGEEDIYDEYCGDSIFRYDRKKQSISTVYSGEMGCREYFNFISFQNDRIIFSYGNGKIASINNNGERKFISDGFTRNYYKVVNDKIYYFDNGLCRVNIDGSGFERLCSEINIPDLDYFICNDKLYYKKSKKLYSGEYALYCCDLNGSNDTFLLGEVYNFFVSDDTLYYTTSRYSDWYKKDLKIALQA